MDMTMGFATRGVRHRLRAGRSAAAVVATVALLAAARPLVAESYADAIEKWRRDYEASLRAEDGYLSVAGLYFLEVGDNTFGSAAGNDIVLPAGAAPARAGVFTVRDGRVKVALAAGVAATVNGVAAGEAELRPASAAPARAADLLHIGRLTLLVHLSGARMAIRLRDPEHAIRRGFTGTRWFPIAAHWRVDGVFVPYATPREVTVPNSMGDEVTLSVPGEVAFSIAGVHHRMQAVAEADGRLWFIFTDATAGRTTYKAARFLYADPPRDGRVVLDFNQAHNPACAYNPFTTCPYPPPQNRLTVAVEAGERDYGRH